MGEYNAEEKVPVNYTQIWMAVPLQNKREHNLISMKVKVYLNTEGI